MERREVGPFVVHELNVGDGLRLLDFAGEDSRELQRELIYATVTKDGLSIKDRVPFRELMPHLAALVTAAVELNGFSEVK